MILLSLLVYYAQQVFTLLSAMHLYVFFQLYELIANKQKACWWAHDESLYLYFVSNIFIFFNV